MGLFKRVSDIISANLNDMTEKYEDPEKMLKQAIREMETSIEESRHQVAKAMASEKMVAKELAENMRLAEQWQSRAEAAIESDDDDMARKAIGRKQEYQKVAAALTDQHAASAEASGTLRRQLEAMQAKMADAKRRLGTLVARQKAADVRSKMALDAVEPQVSPDAFAKFDRMREKVEMAEAQADALRELSGGASREALRDEPETENLELEAELREMKKKRQK